MIEKPQAGFHPDLTRPRPEAGAWAVALVQPLQCLILLGSAEIFDHHRLVESGDVQPIAGRDEFKLMLVQFIGVDGHEMGQGPQLAFPIRQTRRPPRQAVHNPRTRPANANNQGGDDAALACSVIFAHDVLPVVLWLVYGWDYISSQTQLLHYPFLISKNNPPMASL